MPWGEALRMVEILKDDPTSQLGTALGDYTRPWSHEWAVAADLLDWMVKVHAENPRPIPRPWPDPSARRHGRTKKSRAEVIDILNAHGHKIRR